MKLAGLLLVVGLVLAIAAWAVFVPQRPSPDGANAVGRIDLTLRAPDGQSLPITVWYPTNGSGPLAAGTPAPVILYSPGWGGRRWQSSVLAEALASRGFVVVGCDDYASDPAADPDRGASLDLASDAAMSATIERAGRHVATQAGRLLGVLHALDAGQSPLLQGRIDLKRVGVLGYSIGGAAGLQAALIEPRIVAVASLDGGLFGRPATEIGTEAYLLLSSREAFPPESELASADPSVRNYALISALDIPRNTSRMARAGNYWAQLPAADHADLSDALFTFVRAKPFRTNFERRAMNAAIVNTTVAFFRGALLGDDKPMRGLVGRNDQTVRWISSTSTPPGTASARQ